MEREIDVIQLLGDDIRGVCIYTPFFWITVLLVRSIHCICRWLINVGEPSWPRVYSALPVRVVIHSQQSFGHILNSNPKPWDGDRSPVTTRRTNICWLYKYSIWLLVSNKFLPFHKKVQSKQRNVSIVQQTTFPLTGLYKLVFVLVNGDKRNMHVFYISQYQTHHKQYKIYE